MQATCIPDRNRLSGRNADMVCFGLRQTGPAIVLRIPIVGNQLIGILSAYKFQKLRHPGSCLMAQKDGAAAVFLPLVQSAQERRFSAICQWLLSTSTFE